MKCPACWECPGYDTAGGDGDGMCPTCKGWGYLPNADVPRHGAVAEPTATVIFVRTGGIWQADYGHTTVGEGQEFSDAVAAVEKWARDRRLVLVVQGIQIDLVRAPASGSTARPVTERNQPFGPGG